jgi:hypothetical protein
MTTGENPGPDLSSRDTGFTVCKASSRSAREVFSPLSNGWYTAQPRVRVVLCTEGGCNNVTFKKENLLSFMYQAYGGLCVLFSYTTILSKVSGMYNNSEHFFDFNQEILK